MGLASFAVLWPGAKGALGGAKAAPWEKNANLGIKKDGGWYILTLLGNPKMEIAVESTLYNVLHMFLNNTIPLDSSFLVIHRHVCVNPIGLHNSRMLRNMGVHLSRPKWLNLVEDHWAVDGNGSVVRPLNPRNAKGPKASPVLRCK